MFYGPCARPAQRSVAHLDSHAFIGRARTPAGYGIVLCSPTFLAVNLAFALMYTGLWGA